MAASDIINYPPSATFYVYTSALRDAFLDYQNITKALSALALNVNASTHEGKVEKSEQSLASAKKLKPDPKHGRKVHNCQSVANFAIRGTISRPPLRSFN